MTPDKYRISQQVYLLDAEECGRGSQEVKGADVYRTGSGRVREEWLSRCREERALTGDMIHDMYAYYCSKLMKPPST